MIRILSEDDVSKLKPDVDYSEVMTAVAEQLENDRRFDDVKYDAESNTLSAILTISGYEFDLSATISVVRDEVTNSSVKVGYHSGTGSTLSINDLKEIQLAMTDVYEMMDF